MLYASLSALLSHGRAGPLHVSIVEVFKEAIRDLMRPAPASSASAGLRLRDVGPATSVEGATEALVAAPRDLEQLLPSLAAAAASMRAWRKLET